MVHAGRIRLHGCAVLSDAFATRAAGESPDARSEGGDYDWCTRILHHKAGHLVDNAYRLRRRRRHRELFGPSSLPYPKFYDPKPYSKSFVQHIDPWYAQAHPDEDFAQSAAHAKMSYTRLLERITALGMQWLPHRTAADD